MKESKYSPWFDAYVKLVSNDYSLLGITCPNCKKDSMNFKLIGNKDTRIGYGLIWCKDCLIGINISRIEVPKGVDMISFDEASDIQDFRLIYPDDD
jgi:hypothetical protein